MSDVFREVDEEVRHEQWVKLWKAYGHYAIAGVVSVVLVVAGGVGWKEYRTGRQQAESEQFTAAGELLAAGQPELASQRFALLADNASTGYGTLARLREAAALAAAGNATGAVAVLDRLAVDDDADPVLRELAALLAVYQLMDSASRDELDGRLAPLLADGSPWHSSARELSGVLAARGGEAGRAREIFTAIVEDTTAPQAVRSRAAGMLAILDAPSGGG